MENYLLCGELSGTVSVPPQSEASSSNVSGSSVEIHDGGCLHYKGRRKGSVEFVGIWKYSKAKKDVIANGASFKSCL